MLLSLLIRLWAKDCTPDTLEGEGVFLHSRWCSQGGACSKAILSSLFGLTSMFVLQYQYQYQYHSPWFNIVVQTFLDMMSYKGLTLATLVEFIIHHS
jgi:hypothetical protein